MNTKIVLLFTAVLAAAFVVFALSGENRGWSRRPLPPTAIPEGSIAPAEIALTFATYGAADGRRELLLVTGESETGVLAVPLSPWLATGRTDVFEALSTLGRAELVRLASDPDQERKIYPFTALLPAAGGGAHIAFGTNFAAHGAEVANERPFAFPRLVEPSSSITRLPVDPGAALLDYEVELCMRFDRDIATLSDFAAAGKALFLCSDFSDRAILLRKMPVGEEALSGIGFTDAKSIHGYFPTGPYVVVPAQWRSFVDGEIITTTLNGSTMQRVRGEDMLVDFRGIAAFALRHGAEPRWSFRGDPVPLLPDGVIREGQVLLSGTGEGVLFRPPGSMSIAWSVVKYVCLGKFLGDMSLTNYIIEDHIRSGIESGVFLQPGDRVRQQSLYLGTIDTEIVSRD